MQEIGNALAHLGNYRVMHVQELLYPYKPIPASVMLALGFRETGLKNVCGGAVWDGSKWVQSYGDRGYLQITDKYNAAFLASVEGCNNGNWVPADPPVNALAAMHVPRFSPATLYVKDEMNRAVLFAAEHGVPLAQQLRFAVAAHNAGVSGAIDGWRNGNFDKNTAGGDYSSYVLRVAPMIHQWIAEHPNWQYKP